MEQKTISLVDYLARQMRCDCVNYLNYLKPHQQEQLIRVVTEIQPEDYSLWEWNNALEYLTSCSKTETAEQARQQLLTALAHKEH